MKILQINAVGQSGSTGRNCKEIAEYINHHTPHDCYTAFSQGATDEYSYQIGTPVEWKLHAFMSRLSGEQAHFSMKGTKNLFSYMESLKPDVVHLNNLHGNYINLPMLLQYLARKDIPTVATLHDCWFYTGKCCHYTADRCDRWQSGCHNCPRLKKDNKSWFRDATPKLWKEKKSLFEAVPRLAVVGVSDWITSEARKSFLSCAKEITRIYNWIDLDVFSPREGTEQRKKQLGLENEKIVLGVASGWGKAKGLDGFIHLADLLGKDYTVMLIGKMPEHLAFPKNMCHIPATESVDELAEYYTMADVFVTLSLEETFGKVSAEALACGTPVVCYDSTANRELVGAGCGAVLEPGDLEGVANAVRKICNDGKGEYSAACRSFAVDNFAMEERIREYLSLYERLIRAER